MCREQNEVTFFCETRICAPSITARDLKCLRQQVHGPKFINQDSNKPFCDALTSMALGCADFRKINFNHCSCQLNLKPKAVRWLGIGWLP